jgi:Protein of unknown function (DUF2849)
MTAPHEQKLRIAGPVIVTANRLADGAVVYRGRHSGWTTELEDAVVAHNAADASLLLAAAATDGLNAVGAYIAPVRVDANRIAPGNLRELIRQRGPTIALPISAGA